MKKLISIFLAAVMLLSLAACGQTASDAASDAPASSDPSADTSSETPSDPPEGEAPAMADGETPPEKPDGTPPDGENALRIDGATVTLDGITVKKSDGATSNTEDGDFYGMNAALLATNGATVTIQNATVTSSAQNGNGVFSYGSGTTVNVSDSTITTTADAQTLDGNILVDTISSLNLTLKNGSTFTGTVNIAENTEGGTAVSENAVITIESGCTWTLTGDCTITSLTNNGTINFNGHTITLADGTVLR